MCRTGDVGSSPRGWGQEEEVLFVLFPGNTILCLVADAALHEGGQGMYQPGKKKRGWGWGTHRGFAATICSSFSESVVSTSLITERHSCDLNKINFIFLKCVINLLVQYFALFSCTKARLDQKMIRRILNERRKVWTPTYSLEGLLLLGLLKTDLKNFVTRISCHIHISTSPFWENTGPLKNTQLLWFGQAYNFALQVLAV